MKEQRHHPPICFPPSSMPAHTSRRSSSSSPPPSSSSGHVAVHINERQTFYLRKDVLVPKCGLLTRLINAGAGVPILRQDQQPEDHFHPCNNIVSLHLHDFPGGPYAFELVARFCCRSRGGGREGERSGPSFHETLIREDTNVANGDGDDADDDESIVYEDEADNCDFIKAGNVAMLHCAGEFLEMTEHHCENNLLPQTEAFLSNMPTWSFRQCISFLTSCHSLPHNAWTAHMVQRCIDCLVNRIPSSCSNSTDISLMCCSSPDSRPSTETQPAIEAYVFSCLYKDITLLPLPMVDRVVKALISHQVDNRFLAKCLLHYLQCHCSAKKKAESASDNFKETKQSEILETIVTLLYMLECGSVSCKSLFGLQRLAVSLHASKPSRKRIEEMIGTQLHKATLDNILITSRHHTNGGLYDVNLILRLVKAFLRTEDDPEVGFIRAGHLQTVASLLDMYLAEIAPDPGLSASKFKAVAQCLPDYARTSHDELYRALDIYLEAHPKIDEGEAMELGKVICFQKLSLQASKHVAQSLRFPARLTLQVLLQEQETLKATMHVNPIVLAQCSPKPPCPSSSPRSVTTINLNSNCHSISNRNSNLNTSSSSSSTSSLCLYEHLGMQHPDELEYSLVLRQNEELRSDLQEMQMRMMELEKACGQMRSKVSKYMKAKHLMC